MDTSNMDSYHALLADTLQHGVDQYNTRTKHVCRALIGAQLQYDVATGFPAVTTKKLAFSQVKGELIGFFRGYDNAADFRAVGCNIWDDNANKTEAWLANPNRKGTDDLGRIYGVQWTRWSDKRLVANSNVMSMATKGYKILGAISSDFEYDGYVLMEREINQLENALTTILTNPSDRRIIVTAWNPAELDLMALPPCHMDYRFVAIESTKTLHVVMTIRSWDLFIGAPFNIASTAIFLEIMARLSGYTAGSVTIQATNAHIYDNHFDQVREQLSRSHHPSPKLVLSDDIKQVSVAQVKGVFAQIAPSHITLSDYTSHAAIKAEMAS